MESNFDIVKFVAEIVDLLRDTATIDGYTDLGGGKYRILTSDTGTLPNDENRNIGVILSDCDTLNGTFLIENVIDDTSFDIVKIYDDEIGLTNIDSGLTPTLGPDASWKALAPLFFHGEAVIVNQKVDNYPSELNKYPCIILDEPLSYNVPEQSERHGWLNLDVKSLSLAFCDYIGYAENDITKDEFRDKAIIAMRYLALRFFQELKYYDNADNQIDINTVISMSIDEFKNSDYWDFSPTGVYADFGFLLENVYNICRY